MFGSFVVLLFFGFLYFFFNLILFPGRGCFVCFVCVFFCFLHVITVFPPSFHLYLVESGEDLGHVNTSSVSASKPEQF